MDRELLQKERRMTMLLAHHVELHHVPVLAGIFAAGCWIGWEGVSKLLIWRGSRLAPAISSRRRLLTPTRPCPRPESSGHVPLIA